MSARIRRQMRRIRRDKQGLKFNKFVDKVLNNTLVQLDLVEEEALLGIRIAANKERIAYSKYMLRYYQETGRLPPVIL